MRKSIAADDQAWPLPSSSCVTSSGETMRKGERMDQLCCGVRFDAVASKFADVGENVARELPERVRHGLQDELSDFMSLNILFTIIHNPRASAKHPEKERSVLSRYGPANPHCPEGANEMKKQVRYMVTEWLLKGNSSMGWRHLHCDAPHIKYPNPYLPI